jgi:hypothetical protein
VSLLPGCRSKCSPKKQSFLLRGRLAAMGRLGRSG